MSPSALTSKPGMGSDLVRKVQEVGRAWEDHPGWHGRTWYVAVLLAVASLARVVEWFEAERQFWNFEDDDEEDGGEPLTFVLKPEWDDDVPRTPLGNMDDDNPLRLSRDTSLSRRSRDERVPQKDLRGSFSDPPTVAGDPEGPSEAGASLVPASAAAVSTGIASADSSMVAQASDHLRQQADKAKSSNILMELNLDGEHFLYINRTWFDVIG